MQKKIITIVTVLFMALPTLACADKISDLEKQLYLEQKKLVVQKNMQFSDEEAANFWPLYEQTQEKLFKIRQEKNRIISAYASVYAKMTDMDALLLIDEYQQVNKTYLLLMKQYTDDLKVILPGKKAFRYLQVEENLELVSKYKMLRSMPLLLVGDR